MESSWAAGVEEWPSATTVLVNFCLSQLTGNRGPSSEAC